MRKGALRARQIGTAPQTWSMCPWVAMTWSTFTFSFATSARARFGSKPGSMSTPSRVLPQNARKTFCTKGPTTTLRTSRPGMPRR